MNSSGQTVIVLVKSEISICVIIRRGNEYRLFNKVIR